VHYTIIQLIDRAHIGVFAFPTAAALAVALSSIIYLVVERPAARVRRRLSRAD
jgi:peptidoglycan/LPS O-acetylase OafA/YrhL